MNRLDEDLVVLESDLLALDLPANSALVWRARSRIARLETALGYAARADRETAPIGPFEEPGWVIGPWEMEQIREVVG